MTSITLRTDPATHERPGAKSKATRQPKLQPIRSPAKPNRHVPNIVTSKGRDLGFKIWVKAKDKDCQKPMKSHDIREIFRGQVRGIIARGESVAILNDHGSKTKGLGPDNQPIMG